MSSTAAIAVTAALAAATSSFFATAPAPAPAVQLPGGPGSPGAAACTPEIDAGTEPGLRQVLDEAAALRARGSSTREIDTVLADRACLTRVGHPAATEDLEEVRVLAPDVYVITRVRGRDRWVAITRWQWQEVPDHAMDGDEGVVTWFDTEVTPVLHVLHHSGFSAYPSTTTEDAADVNGHGAGFLMDPQVSAADLNVATGTSAFVFEGKDACTDLTARAAYAHTSGATGIDGLTVGPGGPDIDWTRDTGRAVALSAPSTVSGVCPRPGRPDRGRS